MGDKKRSSELESLLAELASLGNDITEEDIKIMEASSLDDFSVWSTEDEQDFKRLEEKLDAEFHSESEDNN